MIGSLNAIETSVEHGRNAANKLLEFFDKGEFVTELPYIMEDTNGAARNADRRMLEFVPAVEAFISVYKHLELTDRRDIAGVCRSRGNWQGLSLKSYDRAHDLLLTCKSLTALEEARNSNFESAWKHEDRSQHMHRALLKSMGQVANAMKLDLRDFVAELDRPV